LPKPGIVAFCPTYLRSEYAALCSLRWLLNFNLTSFLNQLLSMVGFLPTTASFVVLAA
jgi:hypothetical protein